MLRVVKRWTGQRVGRQVGDRGKPVVHWAGGSHRLPTQLEEIESWKPPPPLSRMLGTEGTVPGPQRMLPSHVIKMGFSQITEPGLGEGGIRQVWLGEGTFQSPLPLGN